MGGVDSDGVGFAEVEEGEGASDEVGGGGSGV